MASYQASDYTEKELIEDILGLKDPTDSELEARIIQMIDKYNQVESTANEKLLYDFFNDVYFLLRFYFKKHQVITLNLHSIN